MNDRTQGHDPISESSRNDLLPAPSPGPWLLGPFVLDAAARIVMHSGAPLALGDRAVAVLIALVGRAGQLVTKDQLLTEAWNGQAVEESNLTVQISSLRRVLASVPGGAGWIETLPRRGYRYTGPISEMGGPAVSPFPDKPIELPDKPSLAVLPFQNLSGGVDQEYFADGIVEDITTALSRIDWLFVIARNSSFTFKGRAVDVRQIGKDLGVRYVLEGSVRRAANRLRITAQLIDASNGAHIWADRFDGDLADVFALQDQVTESVAGAIEPKLRYAEIERSHQKPTESLHAYDYFLQALANFNKMTREPNFEAVRLLQRAIAIDPDYTAAYALGALSITFRKGQGWMTDRLAESEEGLRMARIAVDAAPNDATVLYMSSLALAYLGGENERAAAMMDRALLINPNLAAAWHLSGWIRIYLGDGETAMEHFQRAIRLSPLDPLMHIFLSGMSGANLTAGNYEEVLHWSAKALRAGPIFLPALRGRVTALGLLGRLEEARALVPWLMEIEPHLRCSTIANVVPWGPELLERYAAGLRAAGVPE